MNKLTVSTLAALAVAAVAGPAFAQAAGSVDVTGTVASRCTAVTPISGSITLGELTKADGTVDAAFSGNTGGLSRNFSVICNGANPRLSVNALAMVNSAAANPPSGYTNTIHYTATLTASHAGGGSTSVADQSIATGATTGNMSARLAATQNNITLAVGTGASSDANAIVAAGSYAGKVEVIVSPAA
jgi:hypothetical protein